MNENSSIHAPLGNEALLGINLTSTVSPTPIETRAACLPQFWDSLCQMLLGMLYKKKQKTNTINMWTLMKFVFCWTYVLVIVCTSQAPCSNVRVPIIALGTRTP